MIAAVAMSQSLYLTSTPSRRMEGNDGRRVSLSAGSNSDCKPSVENTSQKETQTTATIKCDQSSGEYSVMLSGVHSFATHATDGSSAILKSKSKSVAAEKQSEADQISNRSIRTAGERFDLLTDLGPNPFEKPTDATLDPEKQLRRDIRRASNPTRCGKCERALTRTTRHRLNGCDHEFCLDCALILTRIDPSKDPWASPSVVPSEAPSEAMPDDSLSVAEKMDTAVRLACSLCSSEFDEITDSRGLPVWAISLPDKEGIWSVRPRKVYSISDYDKPVELSRSGELRSLSLSEST